MENEEATAIFGNTAAPYLNSLAATYGMATNFTAVAHPSEPNYLAMFSGSTQGVTDDADYNFSGQTTLGDQLNAAGKDWHMAAQNVPLNCYTGTVASGGADGVGDYARKHEPAISFTQFSGNASQCARITDFSHFDPNQGNYWFIAPNLCNDMHDCSIATGDAFLASFVPTILNSAAFQSGGLLEITFDEGTSNNGGGGTVATILISPYGKLAYVSGTAYDHYSFLRTIEDIWGLPKLGAAASAIPMREFFN